MSMGSVEIKVRGAILTIYYNEDNLSIERIFAAECDDILPLLNKPGAMAEIESKMDAEIKMEREQLAYLAEQDAPAFNTPEWHDQKARAEA